MVTTLLSGTHLDASMCTDQRYARSLSGTHHACACTCTDLWVYLQRTSKHRNCLFPPPPSLKTQDSTAAGTETVAAKERHCNKSCVS
eukprot:1159203-Pelagomonas_calceolata.AAC.13